MSLATGSLLKVNLVGSRAPREHETSANNSVAGCRSQAGTRILRRTGRWAQCFSFRDRNNSDGGLKVIISKPFMGPNLSAEKTLHVFQRSQLKFWVITVSTAGEMLAAATLRAQLFYSYPRPAEKEKDGESLELMKERFSFDFQALDLLKSRIKAEVNRDSKMEFLQMRVKCLLAVCERSMFNELRLETGGENNPLLASPAVSLPELGSTNMVAIGTLDIQVCRTAQGQNLGGVNVNENVAHGYIFNLCVCQAAHRRGVATALMEVASNVGNRMKLNVLYVHVEANNISALGLYYKLGYIVEEEESVEESMRLNRPRRILLSKRIQNF